MRQSCIVTIIDDDESVRFSLGSLVRSLGHAVHSYESADAFLAHRDQERSDCIVSDIQMPGTDGIALKHELDARGSVVPMIMITARGELALTEKAYASGVFGLMRKPLDLDPFIEMLEAALRSSRTA